MNHLYLLLDLGSIAIPLIFSFHPKIKLYRHWKEMGLALIASMAFFIPWDIIFTALGYWGFNDAYLYGFRLFHLPLEEWLFFICIPYACIFTYYALLHYFPGIGLSKNTTKTISLSLLTVLLFTGILNHRHWYTLIVSMYAALITLVVLRTNFELLSRYYPVFLVILIPFFVVNGVLTGSGIENEIVWYDNNENLGIRLFTIPIEDSIYAFALILTPLYIMEQLKKRSAKNHSANNVSRSE